MMSLTYQKAAACVDLVRLLSDHHMTVQGEADNSIARGLAEAHKTRLMKTVHSLTSARLRSLIEVQRMIASWNIKDQSVDEHLRLLADEKSKYMSQVLPDGWHRVNKWTLCNRHDTDSLVGRLVSDVKAPSTSLYPLITAEHVTYTELSMRVLASSITELDMIIVIQQLLHPSDQLVPTRLLDTRRADDHAEVMPTIYFECKQIDSSSKQFLRQEQFQTLVERHQLGPSDSAHAILGTYTVAADLPLIGILEFIIGVDSVATGRSSRPTDNAARHVLLGPDRANVAESSMLSRDPSTLPESSLRLSDSDATTKPSSFGPTSETPSGLRDTQHGKAMDLFAIDQMRTTLQDELDRHQIGLDNERSYLPQRVVSIFTTAEAVRQVFPSLPKGLLQYIVVSIPKTYLITVLSFQTDSMILKALESFRKHSFKDEDLPVSKLTRKDSTRNCGRDWGTPRAAYVEDCHICEGTDPGLHSCSHPSPHFAFHHACWDRYTFDIFFDKQWAFLVQKFNPYDFLYTDLEYDRILPFKRPESRGEIGAGYFSDVQKVELVSEFLNPEIAETLNSEDGTTVSAALKTLKHVPEKQYQVENEWIREASAMKTLNFLRHAHITRGIAAFKHRERFYLLLEWADQTNLQEIWSQNPRPTLNNSSLISWLKQLLGLADALYHMHDTKRARDRRTSSLEPLSKQASKDHFDADQGLELSSSHPLRRSSTTEAQRGDSIPTIIISSDDDPMFSSSEEQGIRSSEGDHWRHGDINPRNIVSFASDDPSPGVLKLADFGRAKRHVAVTALRSTVEHDLWHTAKYEPPDLFVTGYRGAMSRLYDIWSLGCVYFETIIWMLYGLGEIHQMALTSAMHSEGSPYWSRHGPGRAKVSDLVSVWMSFILNNDPRCNAGSSALGDLMKVIREKMLVVELYSDTGAPSRAPAAIIVEELRRIVRRAEVDRKYIDVCLQHAKQVVLPPAFSVSVKHTSKHISQLDSSAAPLPPEAMEAPQVTHSTKYDYVHQDYHSPVSTWKTEDDIDFINHVISQDSPSLSINKERTAQRLCNVCQTLDLIGLQSRIPWRLSEYAKRLEREECVLCTIIHNVARRAGVMASHPVELNIDANGLMINGLATAVMRLCKPVLEPLTYANQSAGNKDALLYQRIQYGAPSLAALPNLGLVREWLNDCDGNHDCAKGLEQVYMPRRLLDVRTLKLVDTKGCEDPVRYMVLSFVWGSKDVFHTNKENLQSHYEGIFPDQLPTLFRDAIVIAKSLDIKYLMIDAICVVQNHHDEIQQYLRSGRDLYNSAYLTLAACSQRDVHGSMMSARFPTQYASIPASLEDEEAKIHVSDLTDDFDHDVLEAPLNRRAWVLEARAFSRRTVYFSEKQLYWECGIGVRCETLTRMNRYVCLEASTIDADIPQLRSFISRRSEVPGQIP